MIKICLLLKKNFAMMKASWVNFILYVILVPLLLGISPLFYQFTVFKWDAPYKKTPGLDTKTEVYKYFQEVKSRSFDANELIGLVDQSNLDDLRELPSAVMSAAEDYVLEKDIIGKSLMSSIKSCGDKEVCWRVSDALFPNYL